MKKFYHFCFEQALLKGFVKSQQVSFNQRIMILYRESTDFSRKVSLPTKPFGLLGGTHRIIQTLTGKVIQCLQISHTGETESLGMWG